MDDGNGGEILDDLWDIRETLWEADIPSPTVPEYVEHHEQIQSIMKLVEKKMEKYKKGGSGMSKMPKLKPCPFCGRHGDLFQIPENNKEENERHPNWSWRDPGMWLVGCWTPECFGNINHKTMVFISPEDAAEKWNERSDGIV